MKHHPRKFVFRISLPVAGRASLIELGRDQRAIADAMEKVLISHPELLEAYDAVCERLLIRKEPPPLEDLQPAQYAAELGPGGKHVIHEIFDLLPQELRPALKRRFRYDG